MIFLFKIGFLSISWLDIIDILLVAFLLYQLYKLMHGSVAVKIFLGILSLYLFYLVVRAAQMELLSTILGQFMGVGVLATIVLFQQEIRKFLLMIGKTTSLKSGESFFRSFSIWRKQEEGGFIISPVIDAMKIMSGTNTGALIVFTRDSQLKFYVDSGDFIDAEISSRLLLSIFNKYSPLHDGAVIIYKNRIRAARCILPVSENDSLPAQYGLRHRAAVGMSELTDTLILVVSEETGEMSVTRNGMVDRNLSGMEIRQKVNEYLLETDMVKPEDEGEKGENKETTKEAEAMLAYAKQAEESA
ncbi:MAG: diadenylate cyclase CdaA [Cyclobacteriaceae bacterium]|nr:diadenylate cyclase CdaA [Cyclobacteriaceae bacterium]